MVRFHHANGRSLAYIDHPTARVDDAVGIFFMCGFNSNMQSVKALVFEEYCLRRELPFTRFDYSGHGQSAGNFIDGCIGDWLEDALAIFDLAVDKPRLIVGSSMGAWIGTLLALRRSRLVSGLVGISSAPDFTERQISTQLSPRQKDELKRSGRMDIPSCYDNEAPYPITAKLIDEGARHLILGNPINLDRPVRLIHGLCDQDIPWQTAVELADWFTHDDVTVTLIKGGDHRLSTDDHLSTALQAVDQFVDQVRTSAP